jgi:hypothetical protein
MESAFRSETPRLARSCPEFCFGCWTAVVINLARRLEGFAALEGDHGFARARSEEPVASRIAKPFTDLRLIQVCSALPPRSSRRPFEEPVGSGATISRLWSTTTV